MDKNCGVCGDRAYGNNFGALTCESCRSFFRRTVKNNQEFKCFYGEKCVINETTRKFCKKCRFDRCLAIGMKRESIRKNGFKKSTNSGIQSISGSEITDSSTDTSDGSVVLETNAFHQNENSVKNFNKCIDFGTIIRGIVFEFSPFEFNRLKELFGATSNLKEQTVVPSSEVNDLMEVMKIMRNRCDVKCRRIVKMSTDITEFSNLNEDDKIVLLKEGCPQIVNLISFINFDFDGQFWTIPIDENNAVKVNLNIFNCVSQSCYEWYKTYLFSMREEVDNDINVLDLLSGILLFNSSIPDLIKREIVGKKEEFYVYLLQRYLEIKHQSKSVAQNKFWRFMNILHEINGVTRLRSQEMSYLKTLKESGALRSTKLVEEIYETN